MRKKEKIMSETEIRSYDEETEELIQYISEKNEASLLVFFYPGLEHSLFDEVYNYIKDMKDNPCADYILGYMYHRGIFIEMDEKKAGFYYCKAAKSGSAMALIHIGLLFVDPKVVYRDYRIPMEYLDIDSEFFINLKFLDYKNLRTLDQRIDTCGIVDFINSLSKLSAQSISPTLMRIILENLTNDKEKIRELDERLKKIETMIDFMPEGEGYHEAKNEFEELQKQD